MSHSILQFLSTFLIPSFLLFFPQSLLPSLSSSHSVKEPLLNLWKRGKLGRIRNQSVNATKNKHKRWILAYPDNKAMSILKDCTSFSEYFSSFQWWCHIHCGNISHPDAKAGGIWNYTFQSSELCKIIHWAKG